MQCRCFWRSSVGGAKKGHCVSCCAPGLSFPRASCVCVPILPAMSRDRRWRYASFTLRMGPAAPLPRCGTPEFGPSRPRTTASRPRRERAVECMPNSASQAQLLSAACPAGRARAGRPPHISSHCDSYIWQHMEHMRGPVCPAHAQLERKARGRGPCAPAHTGNPPPARPAVPPLRSARLQAVAGVIQTWKAA